MDQVIRPGGVTVRDVHTLSFADLLKKQHGIEIGAQQRASLFAPPEARADQQLSLFSPQAPNSPAVVPAPAPAPVQATAPGLARPGAPGSFTPPPAPPPSTTFLEPARVKPGTPAPAPVPIMAAPPAGLVQATPYAPGPALPGYAQARTGNPFLAPRAAPAANLFNAIASQPYGEFFSAGWR